jgi:hypothetical protein
MVPFGVFLPVFPSARRATYCATSTSTGTSTRSILDIRDVPDPSQEGFSMLHIRVSIFMRREIRAQNL